MVRKIKRNRGSVIIELAVASTIFSAISFLFVNACLALTACRLNDNLCREACRLAANRGNTEEATDAVTAVVNSYGERLKHLPFISVPSVESVKLFNVVTANGQHPIVQVITSTKLSMPALAFMGDKVGGQAVNYRQTYAFPVIVPLSENDLDEIVDAGEGVDMGFDPDWNQTTPLIIDGNAAPEPTTGNSIAGQVFEY